MCTRQARPTLSAVLEQLQDKALFAVDPPGSIVKELSCRRNSSCPLDARVQAFAPGLLLALWRSTYSASRPPVTAYSAATAMHTAPKVAHFASSGIQVGALCTTAAASTRRVARRRRADVARQGQRARKR